MTDTVSFTPAIPLERPEILPGVTYRLSVPNGRGDMIDINLTVNELDGRPFEVFLETRDATTMEMLGVSMVLISRLLRLGVPLETVAQDLAEVVSAHTAHFAKQSWCPSLIARIGLVLKSHESRRQALLDLHTPIGDERP